MPSRTYDFNEKTTLQEVGFEMTALLQRIEDNDRASQETVAPIVAALTTLNDMMAQINELSAQLVAAIRNAEQGQSGVETRMADLEVNHRALKNQIVDTAEALKKASPEALADVIAAVDPAAEDAIIPPP